MKKRLVNVIIMICMLFAAALGVNAADIASGDQGGYTDCHFTWRIDSEGTLYINGTGAVFCPNEGPWYEYGDYIKNVVVGEGITSIDDGAFGFTCSNAKTVTLPSSLTLIGGNYGSGMEERDLVNSYTLNSNVVFIVPQGSYAEDYAKRKGYNLSYSGQAAAQATPEPVPAVPEPVTVTTSFGATVSEWAAPEIELAYENNLIPEVMLDFDMTKKVNRGEFAAIALQLYDTLTKSETGLPTSCPFTDISGDINEKAIMKAYGIEVTDGISDTTFEPLSFITREQLATMLCRVIKKYGFEGWTLAKDSEYYMNTDGATLFADDAEISDWAKPSVYYMSLHGIINGVDDNKFAPKNTTTQQEASGYASATREQAIILAQRIFTKSDMLGN